MTDRPLRILGVGDGRSIIFLRWAWRLVERGHEVHIVSDRITDRPGELRGVIPHNVRDLGLLTHIPGIREQAFVRGIGRLARELDVDLVQGHYLLPYGWWAAKAGFHPLVMSPWNTDIFTFGRDRPRGRVRVREAVAAGDRFFVSSLGNEEETIRLGADPAKVERIVWYVDVPPFSPSKRDPNFPARFGWPEDSLVFLSLRNYRPNTNLDVLVPAFARVQKEIPNARLVLAARAGPLKAEIEAQVRSLGIEDKVTFLFVAPDDLPEVCASCDIAVSLASTDATPASMIESMASGLPLVIGDAITIDEWITQGEGGEVVGCRDEDAITAAMLKLARDPELCKKYVERNLKVVAERFTVPPGEAMERLYYSVLDEFGKK